MNTSSVVEIGVFVLRAVAFALTGRWFPASPANDPQAAATVPTKPPRSRQRRQRGPVVVSGSLDLPPEIPAWERELVLPLALQVIDEVLNDAKKNDAD